MSNQDLLDILFSKPDYLSTKEEDLPFIVKRTKVPSTPLSKLKFEPNKVARKIFEFESFYDAVQWRLMNKRINHRLYTGETGEGKTTIAIANALKFTKIKKQTFGFLKRIKKIEFSISHNLLLGQFISLKSQILYDKFKPYEEILVDEFELCVNRMRSTSGQNIDARNTLDAGRFRYNPISGICPSIGSIDKEISSTKMHWNVIAEFNHHKKREVDVIVKYNVHSRDNYEYRWVTFIEMVVEWCPTDLFHEAEDLKRRMIATHEGLKSKSKYLHEEIEKIQVKEQKKQDIKAFEIIDQWKREEITREEAAWRIYSLVNSSYNYVAKMIGSSWETAKKYVKAKEKDSEEGVLTESERKEVID